MHGLPQLLLPARYSPPSFPAQCCPLLLCKITLSACSHLLVKAYDLIPLGQLKYCSPQSLGRTLGLEHL